MKTKHQLRKKFLTLRKKYFEVSEDKFYQLINFIKKKCKTKKKLCCYIIHLIMR